MSSGFLTFCQVCVHADIRLRSLYIGCILLASVIGCGQQDEQREFEADAYSLPSGFTETDDSGTVTGNRDPDDWRISPFFEGLVVIDEPLPHPNPVQTNELFYIDFLVTGIESVNGLYIYVLREDGRINQIYEHPDLSISASNINIQINPLELREFQQGESARGLHRIILFDQRNNIISYGDIRVE